MANHKVVFEIEVEAETSLEAAKTVGNWLEDGKNKWQYYVQSDKNKKVFSVDLSEEDEDAVLEVLNYVPMIK